MTTARFPREARVRTRAEYDTVFKHGRRTASPVFVLHLYRPADAAPPRLGLAVSRKVDPRAVGRNRIKRVLRETFRVQRRHLAAGDYVVVARPAARGLDNAALVRALLALLQRAGALPANGHGGTMPSPSGPEPILPTASAPSRDGGRARSPACP
ncbi:ribonuclease P protein component [Novilysobacter defluvii]|uniref:Ribonuclease P protein component n=1 Tax=Lysobacter defluvii IMMIB APB-9 = DSM 18482 TaxID=1385515 RepID=A0A0A0MB84_9GAMM|nr:ribonuclease P protein component [Lysobacter defluvii]KGO98626.1 ribonuclease P [Lysobacter defluvii IMMIB APB-9 = DSM 18482]